MALIRLRWGTSTWELAADDQTYYVHSVRFEIPTVTRTSTEIQPGKVGKKPAKCWIETEGTVYLSDDGRTAVVR